MRKQRRTVGSATATVKMIRTLSEWIEAEYPGNSLFTIQEAMAREYSKTKLTPSSTQINVRVIDKFYRWCIREKLTLINPFVNIQTSRQVPALQICDDKHIRQIEKFIKAKDSDPELALIMALVLYWGFTARNIAWAQLEISEIGQLKIILHLGELSYRNKRHRRGQILLLPTESKWFHDLQKKYAEVWQLRYEGVKKNFPLCPLILHKQGRHNRQLRTLAIQKRFQKATMLATGLEIPMNIVRRSCGHIHSIQGDASILTDLGWSKDYSFDFMWRPRRLFTGNKK